jgi:hypothetical protein
MKRRSLRIYSIRSKLAFEGEFQGRQPVTNQRGNRDEEQLLLDLQQQKELSRGDRSNPRSNVVSFVDAGTLDVRREAVMRVRASGIFAVPAAKEEK